MIPVDCDIVCICSKIPKITTKKLKNLIQISQTRIRKFSHKPEESRRKKLENPNTEKTIKGQT